METWEAERKVIYRVGVERIGKNFMSFNKLCALADVIGADTSLKCGLCGHSFERDEMIHLANTRGGRRTACPKCLQTANEHSVEIVDLNSNKEK